LLELPEGGTKPEAVTASAASFRGLLPRRHFGSYKNEFGRVGVVAGSKGFAGAALLCSLGALRAGAGLVELFVLDDIYSIVAGAAPPEVMVKSVASYEKLFEEPIDVWAVGPGLGRARRRNPASDRSRAETDGDRRGRCSTSSPRKSRS
jgi:NAD(P)H-hydrate epimerase